MRAGCVKVAEGAHNVDESESVGRGADESVREAGAVVKRRASSCAARGSEWE